MDKYCNISAVTRTPFLILVPLNPKLKDHRALPQKYSNLKTYTTIVNLIITNQNLCSKEVAFFEFLATPTRAQFVSAYLTAIDRDQKFAISRLLLLTNIAGACRWMIIVPITPLLPDHQICPLT